MATQLLLAAPVRPDLTFGLVRHWQATLLECVWCEHPMAQHVRQWRDGWRWQPCGGNDHGVPCPCVIPVVEG